MKQFLFPFLIILLTGSGFFCLGLLVKMREVNRWVVRWIESEHELARFQNRKPRTPQEMEP